MLCLPSIISLCLLLDLDNLSSLQRVLFRTGWGGDDCVGVNCGDQDNDIRDNGDYLQTQTGGDQEPDRYRRRLLLGKKIGPYQKGSSFYSILIKYTA